MEYIKYFSAIFSSISGLGFIIGIVILYKIGLLQFLIDLKKNGKNGNGDNKQLQELKDKFDLLSENELHHISEKLDKIVENTTKEIVYLDDIRNEIKLIKKHG